MAGIFPVLGGGDRRESQAMTRLIAAVGIILAVSCVEAFAQYDNLPLAGNEVILLNQGGRGTTTTGAIAALATGGGGGLGTPLTVSAFGSTQGAATALTATVTIATTVAAGTGVRLTLPYQLVINAGANALSVYPNSGASITGGGTALAANAAFSVGVGSSAVFVCSSSSACYASFSNFQ